MIPIHKGKAPADLVSAGTKHTKELCDAYDADPAEYANGNRKMQIRESIYASEAVKSELEICHHRKCCYCEIPIRTPAYPHVEHWRPQNSSRQERGQGRMRPGYFWLAYSWDNLLWSCAFCNSNKNDLFPLGNPALRARHHKMRLEDETPEIIKPDNIADLSDHITFYMEVPVGLTALGRKTIEVLGLDSPKHECRLEHFKMIREFRKISIDLMDSNDPAAQRWSEYFRKIVEDAVQPDKPYSAMVTAYLATNPFPVRP
jgi:uncharacterized protein (TIGR02646 family)